ncbi:anti-sigma factor [Glycomyces halotolerans]
MSADVHTLIGAYALDAVDEDERGLVERHLAECSACAQEAAEMREAVWRLSDVTVTEPPQEMRERVLAEARRTRQEPPPAQTNDVPLGEDDTAPRRREAPHLRRVLVLAAAAVLIAFAGGAITWVAMQQYVESETGDGERLAAVLEASDAEVGFQEAEGGGGVTVVHSPSLDQAVVVVSDLAEVSEQRSYQVWLVDDVGQVSAGVMAPGETSETMLVDGVGDTRIIGVTNEPAGGSEEPTQPMVVGVELSA